MRWPPHGGKNQVVISHFKPALGRSTVHGEASRSLLNSLEQPIWIEAHHQGIVVYPGTGICINLAGLEAQHFNAFIAQQRERGLMNGF